MVDDVVVRVQASHRKSFSTVQDFNRELHVAFGVWESRIGFDVRARSKKLGKDLRSTVVVGVSLQPPVRELAIPLAIDVYVTVVLVPSKLSAEI